MLTTDDERRGLEVEAVKELQGIARLRFKEGKLDEFKRLAAQADEIVRTKDTGTLEYETHFNDDESECLVLERFRDSDALIEHTANIGELSEKILSIVDVVHGELVGDASEQIREALANSKYDYPHLFSKPI